jgi:hypothetical protein
MHRTHEAEQHLVRSYRVLLADPGADEETKQIAKERVTRFYSELGQPNKLDALLRQSVDQPIPALRE